MTQHLIEMTLPEFTEEFFELIPAQRAYVNKCMANGTIRSYSLSADRAKLWIVFATSTDAQLHRILSKFPIIDYVSYTSFPLMFHNDMEMLLPAISLN
jgi:hypothetical protein